MIYLCAHGASWYTATSVQPRSRLKYTHNTAIFRENYLGTPILAMTWDGALAMIVIIVFLTVIGIAGGIALWNARRQPWRDIAPERLEPRFPQGAVQPRFRPAPRS